MVQQNEDAMIFSYCCYNLNSFNWRDHQIEDGEIWIDKKALVEPEIHSKIKKTASGKKLVEKRVPRDYSIEELIEKNRIIIHNASGTWMMTSSGIDGMAVQLARKMMDEYQKTGTIPEHVVWVS